MELVDSWFMVRGSWSIVLDWEESLMPQVLMRCDTDCEIPAICNATGLTYEQVAEHHDEINGNWQDNLNGSPWHLKDTLHRLKILWREVTYVELLTNSVPLEHVILLVHSPESPILTQHWCNIEYIGPDKVVLKWNYPGKEKRTLDPGKFYDMFHGILPDCLGDLAKCAILCDLTAPPAPQPLPWYKRLWVWVTRLLT
jgi:hypothetical protein